MFGFVNTSHEILFIIAATPNPAGGVCPYRPKRDQISAAYYGI